MTEIAGLQNVKYEFAVESWFEHHLSVVSAQKIPASILILTAGKYGWDLALFPSAMHVSV